MCCKELKLRGNFLGILWLHVNGYTDGEIGLSPLSLPIILKAFYRGRGYVFISLSALTYEPCMFRSYSLWSDL